jgi:hypothetical protein
MGSLLPADSSQGVGRPGRVLTLGSKLAETTVGGILPALQRLLPALWATGFAPPLPALDFRSAAAAVSR